MVSLKHVDAQLAKVGMRNRFFARPEVKELCHILAPNETIKHAVNGHYEGGFALFIATDRRLLLIDKKPWFLTMEDIRYDMVSEVDFFARLIDSSVCLNMINKKLNFTTWRQEKMRKMVSYIQHKVMALQQHNQHNQPYVEEGFAQAVPEMMQDSGQAQADFTHSFMQKIKQHSLAHVAGQMAVDKARTKKIIKPLYPRPSLVSKYGRSRVAPEAAED